MQAADRRGRAGARCCRRRCSSGSRRGARPSSPTRCCRPCARSSAATTRRRRRERPNGRRRSPAWTGARRPSGADQVDAPARPVRRRSRPRRPAHRRGRRPVPRLLEEPRHRRDDGAAAAHSPTRRGLRDRIDAMFRGEHINVTEDRAVLHVALRMPRDDVNSWSTATTSSPTCTRCSTGWRRSRPGARRRVDGRHRASASAPWSTSASAAPTSGRRWPTRPSLDFSRPRHRRAGSCRTSTAPTSGEATRDLDPARDAVHRLLEDVHHAGDADQRAQRPRVAGRRAGRRTRRGQALRGGVDERGGGGGVRHRPREHVRVLGLGRRPLLVRLGHRPVADDRHRSRGVPRDARRLPRDRRALPHRAVRAEPAGAAGPARRLVRRLLRRRRPRRSCRTASYLSTVPRLPPAARHGVERQVGRPRRRAGRRARPGRSCGARRARTASTPTTS